tara:strand:+ start:218 stop:892 length:675 start_codon:yes stop_codon:yes gene_type:complete
MRELILLQTILLGLVLSLTDATWCWICIGAQLIPWLWSLTNKATLATMAIIGASLCTGTLYAFIYLVRLYRFILFPVKQDLDIAVTYMVTLPATALFVLTCLGQLKKLKQVPTTPSIISTVSVLFFHDIVFTALVITTSWAALGITHFVFDSLIAATGPIKNRKIGSFKLIYIVLAVLVLLIVADAICVFNNEGFISIMALVYVIADITIITILQKGTTQTTNI